MKCEVAVVIPAYNAAKWLPQALQSLRAQTMPPSEVVVVDDGSTDDTAQVATAHGAKVVQQQQQGPGAARNRGIRESTAPWIAFLDADDWFEPLKLERQCTRMQQLGAAVSSTDAWLVRGKAVERTKNADRAVPEVLTFDRLLQGNPVICSTVMLQRSVLSERGMFDEDPTLIATEDYDLWLRLSRREPIAYFAEPLTFYRVHDSSLSANARFLRGVDRILDKVAADSDIDAQHRQLIARRRAAARLDVAWDHIAAGRGHEARVVIRDSFAHAVTWKGCRMWARSFLGS
jgi:glycosyltransferase involved in cell wall biosynthesis